jgi:hypothetical protein
MAHYPSGTRSFDSAVLQAEGVRQVAVATASNQASVISAELTFYRTCFKSAISNNVSPSVFGEALKALGVQT